MWFIKVVIGVLHNVIFKNKVLIDNLNPNNVHRYEKY